MDITYVERAEQGSPHGVKAIGGLECASTAMVSRRIDNDSTLHRGQELSPDRSDDIATGAAAGSDLIPCCQDRDIAVRELAGDQEPWDFN